LRSYIATTYGIEIFEDLNIEYNKLKVQDYYDKDQITHGRWAAETDQTTLPKVPRRVYVFNDLPRILECFAYLDIDFDSQLFAYVASNIKSLEIDEGGFKHKPDDKFPIGWFTAQVLKMLSTLIKRLDIDIKKYEKKDRISLITKKHSFSKAALMIGRFQPPHIGHYMGLRAILYGDDKEFYLPMVACKEIINIDKVFLGIARNEISKENPFTIGEVREIWRQVIDNDSSLNKMSKIIEIVSCPSRRDSTNIVDAIYELTYNRDSIIVISGNERVIEQCSKNNIKHFKFKRQYNDLSGTIIRDIISQIDFDNFDEKHDLFESLRTKLHHTALEIMLRDGLLKKSNRIINAV